MFLHSANSTGQRQNRKTPPRCCFPFGSLKGSFVHAASRVCSSWPSLRDASAAEVTGVNMNAPGDLDAFITALLMNSLIVGGRAEGEGAGGKGGRGGRGGGGGGGGRGGEGGGIGMAGGKHDASLFIPNMARCWNGRLRDCQPSGEKCPLKDTLFPSLKGSGGGCLLGFTVLRFYFPLM